MRLWNWSHPLIITGKTDRSIPMTVYEGTWGPACRRPAVQDFKFIINSSARISLDRTYCEVFRHDIAKTDGRTRRALQAPHRPRRSMLTGRIVHDFEIPCCAIVVLQYRSGHGRSGLPVCSRGGRVGNKREVLHRKMNVWIGRKGRGFHALTARESVAHG